MRNTSDQLEDGNIGFAINLSETFQTASFLSFSEEPGSFSALSNQTGVDPPETERVRSLCWHANVCSVYLFPWDVSELFEQGKLTLIQHHPRRRPCGFPGAYMQRSQGSLQTLSTVYVSMSFGYSLAGQLHHNRV